MIGPDKIPPVFEFQSWIRKDLVTEKRSGERCILRAKVLRKLPAGPTGMQRGFCPRNED
jgi:hypothetical protein